MVYWFELHKYTTARFASGPMAAEKEEGHTLQFVEKGGFAVQCSGLIKEAPAAFGGAADVQTGEGGNEILDQLAAGIETAEVAVHCPNEDE